MGKGCGEEGILGDRVVDCEDAEYEDIWCICKCQNASILTHL